MGLSNFHSPADGVLLVLVMNTVLSVALLKNMVRSLLQVMGANGASPNTEEGHQSSHEGCPAMPEAGRTRRGVSITKFKSLCRNGNWPSNDCCVCLCRFEADEEVTELDSCKHFFHKGCLEKWFENQHSTCPLCRSIL